VKLQNVTVFISRLREGFQTPGTLEGFYYFLIKRSKSKQTKYFKYALGRLAKEFPNENPREVLLEWLAEHLYAYERWLYKLREKKFYEELEEAFKISGTPERTSDREVPGGGES
jgi:hypothetical protein